MSQLDIGQDFLFFWQLMVSVLLFVLMLLFLCHIVLILLKLNITTLLKFGFLHFIWYLLLFEGRFLWSLSNSHFLLTVHILTAAIKLET